MRADFWTRERIAALKRLWAQGQTASAIAKTLGGISRAAVLGKIFRLRLGATEKSAKKTGAKAARGKLVQKPSQDRPARRRDRAQDTTAKTPPVSKHKSLLELTNRCCRWPHGEPGTKNFYFCGASGADLENGLPYCPAHMKRAYIVPPEHASTASSSTSLTPWRVISRAA